MGTTSTMTVAEHVLFGHPSTCRADPSLCTTSTRKDTVPGAWVMTITSDFATTAARYTPFELWCRNTAVYTASSPSAGCTASVCHFSTISPRFTTSPNRGATNRTLGPDVCPFTLLECQPSAGQSNSMPRAASHDCFDGATAGRPMAEATMNDAASHSTHPTIATVPAWGAMATADARKPAHNRQGHVRDARIDRWRIYVF